MLELRQKITSQAQTEMSKEQREYMLRQQLRAIQDELGEKNPGEPEAEELRRRFDEADLPDEVRKEVERELERLERLPSAAPDYQITRTYLELVLELPWRGSTDDILDLERAQLVLDEDHYDLEKIKERILEHLAVLKLNPEAKAPILCFVGPPGRGQDLAGPVDRPRPGPQVRADEPGRPARRGRAARPSPHLHRRHARPDHPGHPPGRRQQSGADARRGGQARPRLPRRSRRRPCSRSSTRPRTRPSATTTSTCRSTCRRSSSSPRPTRSTSSRPPLLDRMEVLRLSGYSEEEKVQIAARYLVPRQREQAGLKPEHLTIPPEAIRRIISRYTREAGVRELERMLGRVARKVARRFAEGQTEPVTVGPGDLTDLLGPERFFLEQARKTLEPGVATGLAWTEAGGDVLYVEARLLPGARGLRLTGQLGDVMRESARAAQTFVWSQRRAARRRSRRLPPHGRPHPRAGRRRAQGRPLGRRHHGDGPDLALHQAAGAQRHGHDGRDHAHRAGPAGRRHQGEGAGGPPGRHPPHHPPGRQREGPARAAGIRPRRHDLHRRRADRGRPQGRHPRARFRRLAVPRRNSA